MTDNEKRAHDFAVSILPKMFEIRVNEAQSQEKGNVTIDLYTEYLDIYIIVYLNLLIVIFLMGNSFSPELNINFLGLHSTPNALELFSYQNQFLIDILKNHFSHLLFPLTRTRYNDIVMISNICFATPKNNQLVRRSSPPGF